MQSIVIDSGPLIALFNGNDRYHEQAVRFIQNLQGNLYTNIAVITEVVHMLDFSQQAQQDFLTWVEQAVIIDQGTVEDWESIIQLLQKYADLPADFADASLIVLCQRLNTLDVASIDSDFTVYRNYLKKPFNNLFWD
ncbi:type II toxin-antitoxin system VapC family toxin [Leucothrix pacifica]|uniref:Pilus assembly protein n=1 Tax=Leucothrix pacifica TaxID=1247513 RepID=A0A317C261_9GAMM|nr:PIN domain-containing protein [Leucothrix pacifica]PWQ92439.1 pilus assembly protein [Leucothrix pacifica]